MIDYTDCRQNAPENTFESIPDQVSYTFKAKPDTTPSWKKTMYRNNNTVECSLLFEIPESMGPPVFMYYRLTNFYQNHRRYVQSLYLDQLKGTAVSNATIKSSTCSPLAVDDKTQKAIYPCGLIANSRFNDTIKNPVLKGDESVPYNMTNKGIAWSSDKDLFKKSEYDRYAVVPPPNWASYDYERDGIPDLHEDEELMVWMRTAGLPSFSKLARRNDDTAMEKGRYQLDIVDSMSPNSLTPQLLSVNYEHRFQCHRVCWNQGNSDIDTNCHWWKESFHGNCLRGRGRSVCAPGCSIHDCLSGPA